MRLEHQFGETAGLEPGHPVHRRIGRQPPLEIVNSRAERRQKLFPIHLFHSRLSRKSFQFPGQRSRPLRDVARAEADDVIARARDGGDLRRARREALPACRALPGILPGVDRRKNDDSRRPSRKARDGLV